MKPIAALLLCALCLAPCIALAQSDGSTAESPSIGGSLPESPAAETPPVPTLARVHVIVENVESDEGTVWVALCDSGLSVEGCPYKLSVKATAGFDEVTFTDIPPGVYAVAGYHDVNDNNVFDQIMKIPREPYALSGAAGDKLVPTFDEAALTFVPGDNEVIIRMRRLTGG